MARPQTDIEAGRKLLLDTIDAMVESRGAVDISMTDLAMQAGMSPANIYRFFESKEAVFEAVAERWFAGKVQIMEDVLASDLSAGEKLYEFFARRFINMRSAFRDEPELFGSYCELGSQHFEVVRGYIDLGDHYLAIIVAEAMEEGHFNNLSIDECVSLINQMVTPYCSPDTMMALLHNLSEEKLAKIIETILSGLSNDKVDQAAVRLVS